MEKDKSRGRAHRTNKKKCKTTAPPRKPRALDSNWDRYEEESSENKLTESTDYSVLANMPITQGSHFQFKHDKEAEKDDVVLLTEPNLFNLDLNLLERSLSIIPFNVRSGVSDNLFTENQQRIMNTKIASDEYLIYLKSRDLDKMSEVIFNSDETHSESGESEHEKTVCGSLEKEARPYQNDLESWLDDILDD